MKKITRLISILFLLSFAAYCIYGIVTGYNIASALQNGKKTIGKYINQSRGAKSRSNIFIYYIDHVKYRAIDVDKTQRSLAVNIGKFYRIKYSEAHKGYIEALFDQEVTDTLEILEAGFTIDDIKK